jgi:hypothetical protein
MNTGNKKISIIIAFIFLAASFTYAQFAGINLPQLYITAYIEQNSIATQSTPDPSEQLVQTAIQRVITENYDSRPIADLQALMENDAQFKAQFIDRVTVAYSTGYGAATRTRMNDYLSRYGFGAGGTTPEELAIKESLDYFVQNGGFDLSLITDAKKQQMLNDPILRQKLLAWMTTLHENRQQANAPQPSAQTPTTRPEGSDDPTKENFQLVPSSCFGSKQAASQDIKNAGGCGWKDLIFLINTAIKFMVFIAASLSAIAFAYAGFLYMTAFGQSGKIEQAHGIFSKTITGIFFVLIGWLLVATILKVLGVPNAFSLLNMTGVTSLTP